MSTVATPCIQVCQLDPAGKFCVGCGRTLEEIGNWLRYTEAERAAIMQRLAARRAGKPAPGASDP